MIALSSINKLELLPALFQEIHIVDTVITECAVGGKIIVPDLTHCAWIHPVQSLKDKQKSFLMTLDKGEMDTLNMAFHHNADLVIIDEKKGRNVAEYMGLKITGTLGILLKAKQQGLIESFLTLTQSMQKQGIHYNTKLVKRLALQVGE